MLKRDMTLLSVALLLLLFPSASLAGTPFRPLLGQAPLSKADEGERVEAGFLRYGRFIGSSESPIGSHPDGGGQAGNLYHLGLHDSFGGKAGFVSDNLFLTDRSVGESYRMSQFDYLVGLAFAQEQWRVQVDREEALPLDRKGFGCRYWDIRGTFFISGGEERKAPGVANVRISSPRPWRAAFTIGHFIKNRSAPARGDMTGLAFLRYAAEAEADLYKGKLKLAAAADFLTDKNRRRNVPARLGLSLGIGTELADCELLVSHETDEILDGPGFASAWLLSARYPFGSK